MAVPSRDGNPVVSAVVSEAVDILRRYLLALAGQALVLLQDLVVVSAVALVAEDSVEEVIAVTDLAGLVVVSATKEAAMDLAGPHQMRRLAQVVDGVLEVFLVEVADMTVVERAATVSP